MKNYYQKINALSPKVALTLTRESSGIIEKYSIPFINGGLDILLASFFKKNSKRYGKRDRNFIRELIFAYTRHFLHTQEAFKIVLNYSPKTTKDIEICLLSALCTDSQINKQFIFSVFALLQDPQILENLNQVSFLNNNQIPAAKQISYEYSFPEWLVKKWINCYGQTETAELCKKLNTRAPLDIRVNTKRAETVEIINALKFAQIIAEPLPFSKTGLRIKNNISLNNTAEYKTGLFEVQDEGSQLLTQFIDLKNVSKIWDACCGAGGKTLHLLDATKSARSQCFWLMKII